LREPRGEAYSLPDIGLFDVREISQQLLDAAAGRHRFHDHAHRYTHPADAWLAAHDFRIHRNTVELLHVVIIAQVCRRMARARRTSLEDRRVHRELGKTLLRAAADPIRWKSR